MRAPYDLVKYVAENGRLPVVNFAAGTVAVEDLPILLPTYPPIYLPVYLPSYLPRMNADGVGKHRLLIDTYASRCR